MGTRACTGLAFCLSPLMFEWVVTVRRSASTGEGRAAVRERTASMCGSVRCQPTGVVAQ